MALLTWNQKYSVGVHALDGQHTGLFNILNELHDAMMKGEAQSLTGPLLQKTPGVYAFALQRRRSDDGKNKVSGLAEHRVLHQNLVKQVEGYIDRFDRGEISLNVHLLNFLRDWLTNHIQKMDHQYGPWLNEHGVK